MRKAVQVCKGGSGIVTALCDDGSIWVLKTKNSKDDPDTEKMVWEKFPEIPQDEAVAVGFGLA